MIVSDVPPLTVVDVAPKGPAQRAGLRRGQTVVSINGQPAAHLRRFPALALLDWQVGAANTLTVRPPGGEPVERPLRADVLPMPFTALLPGPFGLLRLDGFSSSGAETAALRAALETFEQAGALGWIIDVRWNTGGVSIDLSRLLVPQGRLFSRQRHNAARLPDGTMLPQRQDIDLNGTALPFQRPLAVLIGPGSLSGAESFAGPMQAHGRATLVGEPTAGLCGVMRSVRLAPGWWICLAVAHTDFGPEAWRLNRIGVTPDVVVTPTPDDEAAGRDPQQEAALDLLRHQAAAS
jgi:carboxyl-terminal processing protease